MLRTNKNKSPLMIMALAGSLFTSNLLRAEEPFNYYYGNEFNTVGLKDYPHGTLITGLNTLVITGDRYSIHCDTSHATVQISFGRDLTPLPATLTKTCLNGWVPIIQISGAEDGPVRYEFTIWATPLPTVKNWQEAYDWPAEDENLRSWTLPPSTAVARGGLDQSAGRPRKRASGNRRSPEARCTIGAPSIRLSETVGHRGDQRHIETEDGSGPRSRARSPERFPLDPAESGGLESNSSSPSVGDAPKEPNCGCLGVSGRDGRSGTGKRPPPTWVGIGALDQSKVW